MLDVVQFFLDPSLLIEVLFWNQCFFQAAERLFLIQRGKHALCVRHPNLFLAKIRQCGASVLEGAN